MNVLPEKTQFLSYYARNLKCMLYINHRQCLEVLSSNKLRIDSIVRKAERVIGECQPSVDSVYLDLVRGKLEMVWSDNSLWSVTESADPMKAINMYNGNFGR